VDAACGRVLDDTLVIFTGDNGYFHGEHQFADKWYAYEESIRVPLLIRDPRLPASRRGGTNGAFVLNVDLAPTLLALAGVAAPETMQGRDLAPLYLAAVPPPWRTEFFMEHATITSKFRIPASEALVRKDVKYIVWPEWDTEELFDLTTDPQEQHNLIADPAHATRLAALRARFAELKAAAR
jgi:arylsulfatase